MGKINQGPLTNISCFGIESTITDFEATQAVVQLPYGECETVHVNIFFQ